MPLTAVMNNEGTFVINNYVEGTIDNGSITISGGYVTNGVISITINKDGEYSFMLRKPEWSKSAFYIRGKNIVAMEDGYTSLKDTFKAGDVIKVCIAKSFVPVYINDSVAFLYPPLVLAFDQYKQKEFSPRDIKFNEKSIVEQGVPEGEEIVRFLIDGYVLTNYDSCGKHYWDENNLMTIWFKNE